MVSTLEERLTRVEERLSELEGALVNRRWSHIGLTSEEAKAELTKPVERGPEELARLRRIFGRFDGPGDLSERMRDYLYGERG